jgi:hypothetical protein
LRAAFQLAAQDAPATEDVLAKLRAAQTGGLFAPPRPKRSWMRQWLPIAAVAAVVIAIAVPIGFAISNGANNSQSSASDSFAGPGKAAAGSSAASSAAAAESGGESGSASGGAINTAPGIIAPSPTAPSPSDGPVCQSADVSLSLTWTAAGTGLRGTLTARNVGGFACDLAIKPAIYPLGPDRVRLDVTTVMTAEGYAGPSLLQPGASATSNITWDSWCGAKADSGAQIVWDGQGDGPPTISVTGPTSPSCVNGKSGSISSTWFSPLS